MYTWSFVGQKYTDELTLHIVNGKKKQSTHTVRCLNRRSPFSICVPDLRWIAVVWQLLFVVWPQPGPFKGRPTVPMHGSYIIYVCTEFAAYSGFHSNVIRGPSLCPAADPFLGERDDKNVMSCWWSLPVTTDPFRWRLMHGDLSYCGKTSTNIHTNTATNTTADRTDWNTLCR